MRSKRPLRRTSRERWRKSGQIHFEPGETLLHKTRAAAQRERTPNPQDFLLIGNKKIARAASVLAGGKRSCGFGLVLNCGL